MLELKNISFEVSSENEKQIDIIRDLSMTVKDGTFVVITGPNGGGKSTMARLIAGIEKPNTGQILLDGVDVTEEGVTERARRGISFAFQQPVRFKSASRRAGNSRSPRRANTCLKWGSAHVIIFTGK